MNDEYEYSFKVNSIDEFIKYCQKNNYEIIENYKQERTLYKNGGKVMARITMNIYNDKITKILNFKDDNLNDKDLNVCRESQDLIITSENEDFVKSLLDILELKENIKLERERVTYKKGNVKFEIDKYLNPKMNVLAIEGLKEEVDIVYNELKSVIEECKVSD